MVSLVNKRWEQIPDKAFPELEKPDFEEKELPMPDLVEDPVCDAAPLMDDSESPMPDSLPEGIKGNKTRKLQSLTTNKKKQSTSPTPKQKLLNGHNPQTQKNGKNAKNKKA